jgi:hypothetical protein
MVARGRSVAGAAAGAAMSTVLWGARRGDVQFGSRDDWRRHIPIGDSRLTVDTANYFDVGDVVMVGARVLRVSGMEPSVLGVRPHEAPG